MKAAYANGVLAAFEEAGYAPFDAVYGTSAGGALAAWFSAGQARYAEGTWKYARDARILSYKRWFTRRGPLLNHEGLLDIVYRSEHPLDQAALRGCAWPVYICAVEIERGRPVYIDLRGSDILAWLKATGRLPFASGPPVVINGQSYLDGGIVDPIPVRRAIADGAEEITVIVNTPVGRRKPENAFIAKLTARRYPHLRGSIMEHAAIKAEALQFLLNPPEGITIHVLRPRVDTGLHRLTRSLKAINRGLKMGREDGAAFIHGRPNVQNGTQLPRVVPTSSSPL